MNPFRIPVPRLVYDWIERFFGESFATHYLAYSDVRY